MRLPLSTGASAFSYTMGVWFVGALVGVPLMFATLMPGWMTYPLGIIGAVWVFGVIFLPFQLRKLRASDLVFGEGGIEVLGGPAGGRRFAPGQPSFHLAFEGETDALTPVARLMAGDVEIAESSDDDEIASLGALVALTAPDDIAADHEVGEAGWEPCGSCGRPLAPSREGSSRCGACGAVNVVPEAVRAGVEAEAVLAETRERSDRAVRGLLDQPRPWRVNVALVLGAIPVVFTWPVLGSVFDEFYQCRAVFQVGHGVLIFLGGLGFSVGGLLLVRAQIEGRIAYRALVTAYRASRPTIAGEPWTCGRCGGPLPEVGAGRVVVRCVYCGTDQILGIDLPGRVAPAQGQARDLEGELGQHTSRRRRYRWLGAGAVGLAVVGAMLLRDPLQTASSSTARNTRCLTTQTPLKRPRPSCEGACARGGCATVRGSCVDPSSDCAGWW